MDTSQFLVLGTIHQQLFLFDNLRFYSRQSAYQDQIKHMVMRSQNTANIIIEDVDQLKADGDLST